MNCECRATGSVQCPGHDEIQAAVEAAGLRIYGGFHAEAGDNLPGGGQTLIMLGPNEPGFWGKVSRQPEFTDGQPHPLDRWSRRVIDRIATEFGATACYPFGGPPWLPFFSWALRTGRCWQSPVRFLVHEVAGLHVSFRGALSFGSKINLPLANSTSPCLDCADQPCLDSCPVGAIDGQNYDSASCKTHVSSKEGQDCLDRGCIVRRKCPVSAAFGRSTAQSRFHQLAFIRGVN